MKHRQPGLFDIEERTAKLTKMGDPLVELKARIDWEAFRPELNRVHEKDRKSDAGAKPIKANGINVLKGKKRKITCLK